MQVSAQDLVNTLTSVQAVVVSGSLSDEQKLAILRDIQSGIPPVQFCSNSAQTRAILSAKILEAMDGLTPKKAESKKPIKGGPRNASTKGTKK